MSGLPARRADTPRLATGEGVDQLADDFLPGEPRSRFVVLCDDCARPG